MVESEVMFESKNENREQEIFWFWFYIFNKPYLDTQF